MAELNRAGIPTGVLVAPLMPGINDSPEQVERILELCAEAGAVEHRRHLPAPARRGARASFMDWLRSYRPDLVPRYEELYARGAYAPKAERERIAGAGPRAAGATPPDPAPFSPTRRRPEPAARAASRRQATLF